MTDVTLCSAYDQISGRGCRFYAGHGGKHNFARLDHDCALERELRRALDEMTKDFAEALDLFHLNWCTAHGHTPSPETFARAAELGKKLGRKPNYP
jgi:hypothetical protein